MKKTAALLLCIVLLAAMFVMTGCSRKSTVIMTVDGFEAVTIVPAAKPDNATGCAKQEEPTGTKYIYNGLPDGDNEMLLLDINGNSCPFTLKLHNGKVEVETPEGVTVTATVK